MSNVLDKIKEVCELEAYKLTKKKNPTKEDLLDMDKIWDVVKFIDDYEHAIKILKEDRNYGGRVR